MNSLAFSVSSWMSSAAQDDTTLLWSDAHAHSTWKETHLLLNISPRGWAGGLGDAEHNSL